MIKEYAVDPEAFVAEYLRLHGHFGIPYGRVISDFPKNWITMVLRTCPSGYRKTNELITVLQGLQSRNAIVNAFRLYIQRKQWLENAIEQHKLRPFGAVITQNNPTKEPAILIPSGPFENNTLFSSSSTITIKREAQSIAECAFSLIKYSNEVILVDPHFCTMNQRHLRPLRLLLEMIEKAKDCSINKIVYHTGDDTADDYHLQKRLDRLIPEDMTIELIRWPTDLLHNRYVLTNLGGLHFGNGLDETVSDDHTQDDDVSILSLKSYLHRWNQFKKTDYEKITIEGSRKFK